MSVCLSVRACLYFDSPPSVLAPSSSSLHWFHFISHWVLSSTEIGNLFVHFHGWPEWVNVPSIPAQCWVTSDSHSVHLFQSMRNNMADLLFDPSSAMLSIALDTLLQLTENSNASQPNCVYVSSVFKCTCVSECVCVCVCVCVCGVCVCSEYTMG